MAFYKKISDSEMLEAPNFVHGPGYSLTADVVGSLELPVDGWYWFNTKEDALTVLEVVEPAVEPEEEEVHPSLQGLNLA
jgi:hypothetical protein